MPERPVLEPSKLNKDIVNRLVPFGFKYEDTIQAFSDNKLHPIKNTYYLLCEMLQREEKKRREDRRKNAFKMMMGKDSGGNENSQSVSSLYSIDELNSPDSTQPRQLQPLSSNGTDSSSPKKEQFKAFGSMPNALDQASNPRRTSTPANILSAFMKNSAQPNGSSKQSEPSSPSSAQESSSISEEAQRRASTSLIPRSSTTTANSNSPGGVGKGDDIREVHGWFFNVATTSKKPRDEIIAEIKRVVVENGLAPRMMNGPNIVTCLDLNPDSASNQLEFEIEVCKVPNLALLGLHFRRINGSLWQYKKICGKLLSQMSL